MIIIYTNIVEIGTCVLRIFSPILIFFHYLCNINSDVQMKTFLPAIVRKTSISTSLVRPADETALWSPPTS